MRRNTVQVIVCCMMLSLSVLTDAYGLSVQVGKKNGATKTIHQVKKDAKQVTAVPKNNKMTKSPTNGSEVRTNAPELDKQSKSLNPVNKLSFEINELKRMYSQLKKEIANDPNNSGKLQLQQQIEKELTIREMQQSSKERRKQVKQNRIIKKLFNPTQSLASISPGIMLDSQTTSNERASQSLLGNQQELYHRSYLKSSPQVHSPIQNNLSLRRITSHDSIAPNTQPVKQQRTKHVIFPQRFIQQNQLTRLNNINTAALQQIPAGHVLVPLSSLSSPTNDVHSRGAVSNRFVVMSSFPNANRIIMPSGNSAKKAIIMLPARLPTSRISSPSKVSSSQDKQSSTTTLSTATTSIPLSTTMSDLEVTTTPDAGTFNNKFLKGKIKKQNLEIRKLRLEIQALVREAKQNQPEIEHEDMAQTLPPI